MVNTLLCNKKLIIDMRYIRLVKLTERNIAEYALINPSCILWDHNSWNNYLIRYIYPDGYIEKLYYLLEDEFELDMINETIYEYENSKW